MRSDPLARKIAHDKKKLSIDRQMEGEMSEVPRRTNYGFALSEFFVDLLGSLVPGVLLHSSQAFAFCGLQWQFFKPSSFPSISPRL